ncbi:MAG: hypothetical protein ACRD0V_21420 [Acidimicrobiales bacterium]
MDRCGCCDPPTHSCDKAAEDRAPAPLSTHPAWFPALWPGVCEHCGGVFLRGTPIRMEAAGYRAECCSGGA